MNKCRYTPFHKAIKYAYISIVPIIALIVLSAGVYLFVSMAFSADLLWQGICALMVCLAIGAFQITLGIKLYLFENRSLTISCDGISFSRGGHGLHRWQDIKSICILIFSANASLSVYETVICVFLTVPDDHMLRRLLRGYVYAANRMKEMAIIDYSDEVLSEIAKYFNPGVEDLRDKQKRAWEICA